MTDRLKEIRDRLEKATPGPWEPHGLHVALVSEKKPICLISDWVGFDKALNNIDFIANSPSDIQFLLDEVDAYKKGAEALHRGLDEHMEEIKRLEKKVVKAFQSGHNQGYEEGYYDIGEYKRKHEQ